MNQAGPAHLPPILSKKYHLESQVIEMSFVDFCGGFDFVNRVFARRIIELQDINRSEKSVFFEHGLEQRHGIGVEEFHRLFLCLRL